MITVIIVIATCAALGFASRRFVKHRLWIPAATIAVILVIAVFVCLYYAVDPESPQMAVRGAYLTLGIASFGGGEGLARLSRTDHPSTRGSALT